MPFPLIDVVTTKFILSLNGFGYALTVGACDGVVISVVRDVARLIVVGVPQTVGELLGEQLLSVTTLIIYPEPAGMWLKVISFVFEVWMELPGCTPGILSPFLSVMV